MAFPYGMPITLQGIKVATINSDGTYGTAVALKKQQQLTIQLVADTDELKSGAQVSDLLTIITHATGTVQAGAITYAAGTVLFGGANSNSSSASINEWRVKAGKQMGYFGLIGKLMVNQGGDIHIGLPRCMADTVPQLTMTEDGQFYLPSLPIRIIRKSDTDDNLIYWDENETAADIPDDFDTFFTS